MYSWRMHAWEMHQQRQTMQFFYFNKNEPWASVIKSPGLQEKAEGRKGVFTQRSISKDPQVPFTCWGCPGVHTCWTVIRCFQKTFPSIWLLSSITCERNFAKLSFLSLAKVILWSFFLKVHTVWRWEYTSALMCICMCSRVCMLCLLFLSASFCWNLSHMTIEVSFARIFRTLALLF